jgi:formiminoglutamate deiminase
VTAYWCENAWLPEGVVASVRVAGVDGVVSQVEVGASPQPGDVPLRGVVIPGMANAHSHAFHRALRGRTHDDGGTFWTWRERMYAVAARLDPDSYLRLATAVYAEMALAGITAVGEFHYLHHGPGGVPYDDPNAMGLALVDAARTAGIRITLLDACYLEGGLDASGYLPLDPVQRRFSDGDAERWLDRVLALQSGTADRDHVVVGRAIHSVRAVRPGDFSTVADNRIGGPLHVHLSEQRAENDACLAVHGCTPTALLEREWLFDEELTVVHAVHLTDADVRLLGRGGVSVCACPTTEADLADGIAPFGRLARAGAQICLGSDQQVQTDLLVEAQRLDQHERLLSGRRGSFRPSGMVHDLTVSGHRSLGWPLAGEISRGHRLDLVALRLDSVRTAGAALEQVLTCATATDVTDVVVDGERVVTDGQHRLGDVGRLLQEAIEPLWA